MLLFQLTVTKMNGNQISYHDFSFYDFNHIVNATCIADNGFEVIEVSKTIDRGMLDLLLWNYLGFSSDFFINVQPHFVWQYLQVSQRWISYG